MLNLKLVEIWKYAMYIIPAVLFFIILLLVMGQGKKNLMQIMRHGVKRLKKVFILVLVFSLAFSGVYLVMEQKELSSQATALIGFNYPEASSGLNPNKTRFNAAEIISDEVLETAISNGNFQKVTVDDLRNCLKVRPKESSETLSLEQRYLSTEYILTYEASNRTAHLNPGTVVDMVAHAYYEIFVDTYSRKTDVIAMNDFQELEELDYLDISDLFDTRAQSIENYALLMANENASFESETTGETFSSIAEKVSTFRDTQLERYEAFVLTYGLAKNKEQYIAKLNYDNKITSIHYMKNVATYEIGLETIDKYERDMATIVLVPSEDLQGKYYMSRTKIGVDYFADEAETAMQQAADQQLEIETNNYAIEQMQASSSTEENIAQVESMIESLRTEYLSLSEKMINTLHDYDKKTTNKYITIVVNNVENISSGDMKFAVILGIGMLILLSVLVIVLPYKEGFATTVSGQKEKIKRRRVRKGE